MNRAEFIASCKDLSEAQLLEIVGKCRAQAASRIPPEVAARFRSLDGVTTVTEHFLETAFTAKTGVKTHVFEVRADSAPDGCPIFVNIHGGGWSLDHTERDIYFSRRMAVRLNCLVIDVDYVLAPEYPYPAALEELEALFDELPALARQWNGDIGRVIICGQSAGGNLAAGVLQRKRFTPIPGIRAQLLCYPPAENYSDMYHGGELDPRAMTTEYYGFFYNRVFEERKNSDVSLVYAAEEDMRGLPPTAVLTAGMDPLTPDAKKYAERLAAFGIPTVYECFEKSRHGFVVNLYDECEACEDRLTALSKQYLGL